MPKRMLACFLLVTLALTACHPVQKIDPPDVGPDVLSVPLDGKNIREGGTLKMALSAEPDKLDPTTSTSLYTRYVMEPMCQKLYDIDADGKIVPLLASGLPKISDAGKRVKIPLKTGVKFADGTDFDGSAVKTTIERGLTHENSGRKSELGPISDITAQDHSVTVDFKQPHAPFVAALADRAGMILSPKALKEKGDNFGDAPVCVGPFKFVKRVPQTSIELERDPNYYDQKSIHLDKIVYQIMTDANIRAANVRSGDVQVADTISPQDFDSLQKEGKVGTLQGKSLGYQGLTINFKAAEQNRSSGSALLASNPRVREALAMSIDRSALTNIVFNGRYDPACSFISPTSPFSTDRAQACPEFNPERSKQILKEEGVQTPVSFTLRLSNTQDGLRFAQALQSQVKEGGFDMKLEPMEYTAVLDAQTRGDFEVIYLGWSGRIDPNDNSAGFLSTDGSKNYSGVSDSKLDQLLVDAATETDTKKRAKLYADVIERQAKINSIIYMYRQGLLTAYSKDVAGIDVFADGVVHLSGAAFVDQEN